CEFDIFFNFGSHARKLFRRQRRDDFLETRIATQRIPEWVQFQPAVCYRARNPYQDIQLLQGEFFFASPGTDDGEDLNHIRTAECIPFDWKKLNRPAALSQCVVL